MEDVPIENNFQICVAVNPLKWLFFVVAHDRFHTNTASMLV